MSGKYHSVVMYITINIILHLMISKSSTTLADLGLLYAAAIWGATFFLVKNSLENIHPVTLVAYRFCLAALFLVPFLLLKKKKLFRNFSSGLILGIFLWLIYIPQTIGLEFTSASNSGFITGLFVVFVPLFSLLFFRILPSPIRLIAGAMSLTGLWLLTGGIHGMNNGDILTIITAMAYAAHILWVDKYVKNDSDPYVLSFQQFLCVGVFSVFSVWIFGLPLSFTTPKATGSIILFLTLFPTLSGFVVQLVAQKFTTPMKASLILALEPVFAAVFAWTLGGEMFVLRHALGGFLIFAGMVFSELPTRKIIFGKIRGK